MLIATFVMSVRQLLYLCRLCCNILCVCLSTFTISAMAAVYCLDNFCLLSKSARTRGAVREPLGFAIISCFNFGGHLFHTQFCTLQFLQKIRFSSKHVLNIIPKSTQTEASNRYKFMLCSFVVSRGAQK